MLQSEFDLRFIQRFRGRFLRFWLDSDIRCEEIGRNAQKEAEFRASQCEHVLSRQYGRKLREFYSFEHFAHNSPSFFSDRAILQAKRSEFG